MALDHQRAKELASHIGAVSDIRRRSERWRLTDCDVETLSRMRHALIDAMVSLEKRLDQADSYFMTFLQRAEPLDAEKARREIDLLADEWEQLNERLTEVDDALLSRQLRTRLVSLFRGERRLQVWEGGVFILILVAIVLTVIELFNPPPAEIERIFVLVDTSICAVLIADFVMRWSLADDRSWFFRRHWVDLVASIPFYEALRFGRLVSILRYARLFRLLRGRRALRLLLSRLRSLDTLIETFSMTLLKRSVLTTAALLLVGALGIQAVERSQAAAPLALVDSLWWSFTTIVTGGFADLYNPATGLGQLVTAGLVLLGLTVTGIFTASLTSVLVEDDASRLEQTQVQLESQLQIIDQKLNLLSGENNAGLLALEEAAQALSNHRAPLAVAETLARTMISDFECLQASVHLLGPRQRSLYRIYSIGQEQAAPAQQIVVGETLAGRLTAQLLALPDAAAIDIEPVTEPSAVIRGLVMVCPLVAHHRVLGMLHLVLPDELARFYVYNRAPMTLAHHAALALAALPLNVAGEDGDS